MLLSLVQRNNATNRWKTTTSVSPVDDLTLASRYLFSIRTTRPAMTHAREYSKRQSWVVFRIFEIIYSEYIF